MAQVISYPQSERQRKLQSLTFQENSILSRDLPRDTVLKSLQLRLSGSIVTTFASGTPVADAQSIFDNIIPRIDIVVNGSRVVKSVRPHLMRMQQIMFSTVQAERRSSAGAAAATDNYPTADGGFAYGTTGQTTTAAESIYLPFEMIWSEVGLGRESTWLNLKGVASAEIRLTTSAFSKFLGFGNTAPVVYSASTFIVDILTSEAQDVPAGLAFSDWKQTTKQQLFSAQVSDYPIDINRGNKLAGMLIFAQDGAAGSATTASGKLASNLAVTKLSLKVNGSTDIKTTDFKALRAENALRKGYNAPFSGGVSVMDGVAHMDLLARKDITTALDVSAPLVDNVQLFIDTNTASNVSYTNPVSVTIQTEEIVVPR